MPADLGDSSKPGGRGAESWLMHASAEWTDVHMEDSADDVAAASLAAFADLGGLAPAAWTGRRWVCADTEPALERGCAWDGALCLGLCGDWLHSSKVGGVWRNGQTAGAACAAIDLTVGAALSCAIDGHKESGTCNLFRKVFARGCGVPRGGLVPVLCSA